MPCGGIMTDPKFIPKPIIKIEYAKWEFIFLFALFDFWIGVYFDPKNRSWYICPLPCFVFYFGRKQESHKTQEGS
jgi:hypothetical protein